VDSEEEETGGGGGVLKAGAVGSPDLLQHASDHRDRLVARLTVPSTQSLSPYDTAMFTQSVVAQPQLRSVGVYLGSGIIVDVSDSRRRSKGQMV
jgi:hypothetical protein